MFYELYTYPTYQTEPSLVYPDHTRYYDEAEEAEVHVSDREKVGKTQFGGYVFKGKFVNSGNITPVVVKTYLFRKILENNSEGRRVTNENPISEVVLHRRITELVVQNEGHPAGLTRCLGVFVTLHPERTLHLVTNYIANGDFYHMLFYVDGVLPNASQLFHQLVEIVKFLHDNSLYHFDLSIENILYCPETQRIYLIDFGSCQYSESDSIPHKFLGKARYASPEMYHCLQDALIPSKVDVFALGIIFLILHLPQGLASIEESHKAPHPLRSKIFPLIAQGRTVFRSALQTIPGFSDSMADVCAAMLDINPNARCSVQGIIDSVWWHMTL